MMDGQTIVLRKFGVLSLDWVAQRFMEVSVFRIYCLAAAVGTLLVSALAVAKSETKGTRAVEPGALAPAPVITRDERELMEEISVEGYVVSDRLDPVKIGRIRNDGGRGGRLYRQRRYEEAFPYLMSAAQMGFKLAQARVSVIYERGLGGIPQNANAAIGWLGVAASPVTDPEIRNYFNKLMDHVPAKYMPTVDRIVAAYTSQYGSKAVGLDCSRVRMAGTHISRLKCDFESEFEYDGLDQAAILEGVINSGSSGAGP